MNNLNLFTIEHMGSILIDHARLLEVRQVFLDEGISVAEWARERRFSCALVYSVLRGRIHATRGQSHQIAVALGLKKGTNRLGMKSIESGADQTPTQP